MRGPPIHFREAKPTTTSSLNDAFTVMTRKTKRCCTKGKVTWEKFARWQAFKKEAAQPTFFA
jgi:hypothetical protein